MSKNKTKKEYGWPGKNGRFKCRHCGGRFDLSPSEEENHDEGYYMHDPDECRDCAELQSESYWQDYPEYSDADPGL